MTPDEYAHQCYLADLRNFRASYPETLSYLHGDDLTRRCEELHIDPVRFISNTYLESLLLAAVCAHDFDHFHHYREKIDFNRRLGMISGLKGLRLPQTMFSNLQWTAQQLHYLSNGIGSLVPKWARTYGTIIGSAGDGVRIVAALLKDDDVYECPKLVRPDFIEAIRAGLRTAADQLGLQ